MLLSGSIGEEESMTKRSDDVLRGPLAAHATGFRQELTRLGYSKQAANKHLHLMAHLSRWLEGQGLGPSDVATAAVDPFFHSRREAGYANLLTARSLVPLVGFLRRVGVVPEPQPLALAGPVEVLLADFRVHLVQERGLVEGTVRFYVRVARLFISERLQGDALDLAGLRADDVTGSQTAWWWSWSSSTAPRRGLRQSRHFEGGLPARYRTAPPPGPNDDGWLHAEFGAQRRHVDVPCAPQAVDLSSVLEVAQESFEQEPSVLVAGRLPRCHVAKRRHVLVRPGLLPRIEWSTVVSEATLGRAPILIEELHQYLEPLARVHVEGEPVAVAELEGSSAPSQGLVRLNRQSALPLGECPDLSERRLGPHERLPVGHVDCLVACPTEFWATGSSPSGSRSSMRSTDRSGQRRTRQG